MVINQKRDLEAISSCTDMVKSVELSKTVFAKLMNGVNCFCRRIHKKLDTVTQNKIPLFYLSKPEIIISVLGLKNK